MSSPLATEESAPQDVQDKEKLRFEMELEFVQCLANPMCLNFLAQQLYFEDEAFVNYLKYLLYWKKPEYAKFIVYPHALYFLDLLQDSEYRKILKNTKVCEEIHLQQFYHWQYYHHVKKENAESKPSESQTAAVKSEEVSSS